MAKDIKSSDTNYSWCTLIFHGSALKAKVRHVRRGKFQITGDMNQGKFIGKTVDASHILHCD